MEYPLWETPPSPWPYTQAVGICVSPKPCITLLYLSVPKPKPWPFTLDKIRFITSIEGKLKNKNPWLYTLTMKPVRPA